MEYVVLKDYVNPAGELVKMAEIVELPDDRFTSGLIQHDFITKAETYDKLRALAAEVTAHFLDMVGSLAEALAQPGEKQ